MNDAPAWYAVVDTARDPSLYPLVSRTSRHQCLFSGEVEPALASALPYLVRMQTGEELADRWTAEGGSGHWGLLLQSRATMDRLRLHLKKFLNALLPDGNLVLFRFYDPVVFRRYLFAATPAERTPWFKEVDRYVVEGDQPGARHDFHLRGGQLFDGAGPVA